MAIIEELITEKVLKYAERICSRIHDAKLRAMFRNCYLNTLATTVKVLNDGSYFIITGDIEAMWLRDSTSQIKQYLPLAKSDLLVQRLFEGVIARQMLYVSIDPYANAFNAEADNRGHKDDTLQNPWVWERKYEVDSLCSPVELAYLYWKYSGNSDVFNDTFKNTLCAMLTLWKREQRHGESSPYSFERTNCPVTDTLKNNGKGTPVSYTGMTWSGFRPSDDATEYGYNVPGNMFLTVILRYIGEIAKEVYHDEVLENAAVSLQEEVEKGIERYAVVAHEKFGKIYAYEVDGLGGSTLMDDANVPSLLSIPYIGYHADKEIYNNTRRFLLSKGNPYYFEGKWAKGIGSPHTPHGYVWPIGMTMQALTSEDEGEIRRLLETLVNTDANTGFMHESFDPDNPNRFTRNWFAWANSLFAQLIIKLCEQNFEL